jgi:hypothetical protein
VVLASVTLWVASGRSTTLTEENFDKIEVGMTIQDVDSILGIERVAALGNWPAQQFLYGGPETMFVPATVIQVFLKPDETDEERRVCRKTFWAPAFRDKCRHTWEQVALRLGL